MKTSLLLFVLLASACSSATGHTRVADPTYHPAGPAGKGGRTRPDPACRTITRSELKTGHRLRGGPDGEQLLTTLPVRTPRVLPAGHPTWRWAPPSPLPAASTSAKVTVVYSPHPDDETLSMGLPIQQAVARGDRVVLVALTGGGSTASFDEVNARLAATGQPTLDRGRLGQVRMDEMRRAATALGIAPGDVYAARVDDPSSDCGAEVTLAEALQVEQAFAARFPNATHLTMSFAAERQPDHLAAGEALLELAHRGVVRHPLWAVSRLWWQLPMPACTWVFGAGPVAAERAYTTWDPKAGLFAVGYMSVRLQFDGLRRDPRALLHGADGPWGSCAPAPRRGA